LVREALVRPLVTAVDPRARPEAVRPAPGSGLLATVERWAALPVAVVVAVLARLAYVWLLAGTKLSDDEISFWTIAGNVAHGRGFSYAGRATAWRPPLYTGLLAAARWAGTSVRTVEVGQALLGGATPVLFYVLTIRLGGSKRAATLAAWIGGLYPPFVYFAGRILSENLAIPLYVLALWLTVEWLQRRSFGWAVVCGAGWGLSILGRPTSIPVAVLAAVIGAVVIAGRPADRPPGDAGRSTGPPGGQAGAHPPPVLPRLATGVGQGLVLLAAALVCLLPWMIRNDGAVGGPEPVTSNAGFTLWVSNRLDTSQLKNVLDTTRYPGIQDYSVYGRDFPGIEALARAKGFDFDHAGEAAQDAWFRRLALHDISADPLRFAQRTVRRAGDVLVPAPDYSTQSAKTGTAASLVLWVTSGPVIVVGALGLILLVVATRRAASVFLALTALGALLFVAIQVPYVRYRVDGVDPPLIPAAAWLVADGWRRIRAGLGPGRSVPGG
jgi:hypothetical protein